MNGPIAYLGCSNTRMAVSGYALVGGKQFWGTPGTVYNGGTIPNWASGGYWPMFEQLRHSYGDPAAVWMEVCLLASETNMNANIASAVRVVLDLRTRTKAPLYISGLQPYIGHACKLAGADGPARCQKIADWLVYHRLGQTGPLLPGLDLAHCKGDGCHPNPAGMELLGHALLEFFG